MQTLLVLALTHVAAAQDVVEPETSAPPAEDVGKVPMPCTRGWDELREDTLWMRDRDPDRARDRWVALVDAADTQHKVWKKTRVGGVEVFQDVDGDGLSDWEDLCPGLAEDRAETPHDGCPDDGRTEPYELEDARRYAKGEIEGYGDDLDLLQSVSSIVADRTRASELLSAAVQAYEDLDFPRSRQLLAEARSLGLRSDDALQLERMLDEAGAPIASAPIQAPAPVQAPAPRPAPVAVAPAPVAPAALPSVDGRLATGQRNTRDTAVVVGISDYLRLPDVPYADRDADAFYSWLVYTRGIPMDRIQIPATGSREHIERAVEQAGREVGAGGTVWVYFAGHGAADPTTRERIVLGDDANADTTSFSSRGVAVGRLEDLAAAGGGQPVLLLDACFTGVGRGGSDLVAGLRFAVPTFATTTRTEAVQWNAAGPNQAAGPLEEVEHGAFTYLVVGALRGWADGELTGSRDGKVTGEEAQAYVSRALKALQLRDQRPVWLGPSSMVLSEGATEVGPRLE